MLMQHKTKVFKGAKEVIKLVTEEKELDFAFKCDSTMIIKKMGASMDWGILNLVLSRLYL